MLKGYEKLLRELQASATRAEAGFRDKDRREQLSEVLIARGLVQIVLPARDAMKKSLEQLQDDARSLKRSASASSKGSDTEVQRFVKANERLQGLRAEALRALRYLKNQEHVRMGTRGEGERSLRRAGPDKDA